MKLLEAEKSKASEGEKVYKIVKDDKGTILKEHFSLFKNELDYIGAKKPLLITFGGAAAGILEKGFDRGYLKKNDYHIKNIAHYSNASFDAIAKNWNEKLKEFITIPIDKETLKNKWLHHGILF